MDIITQTENRGKRGMDFILHGFFSLYFQIFQISVYLVMWIYVLFGAMASGHPGTSNDAWRSSKHVRHQAQENDVIKSDHEKKVLHKTSPTSKTKIDAGVVK